MQELDIKEIWQTQKLSTPDLQEDELERMLRNRSQSIVDKLKKITRIEHIGNIIVGSFLILFFLFQKEYSFSSFLFVFMVFTIVYYKKLYNKLQSIQPTSDVHDYLIQVHEKLKDFIWKYQVALIILFTIAFFLGFYLAVKDKPLEGRLTDPALIIRVLSTYFVSLAFCFLIVYLLYGIKAKKIKKMLEELEG